MFSSHVFIPFAVEAIPVVFNERLIVLYSSRMPEKTDFLSICDYHTGELIAEVPNHGLGLGCALVVGSTLHFWGTDQTTSKTIRHMSTTDPALLAWSALDDAWTTTAPGQYLFNTSVCHDPLNNRYVMAYETDEPGKPMFNIRWFESSSPNGPWSPYGGVFGADRYVACPTLKFSTVSNWWYMFYLVNEGGQFRTRVAKAADPSAVWTESTSCILIPKFPDDLTNVSDFDFIEFNSVTYAVYAVGDQTTAMDIKRVWWTQTQNQFLAAIP